MLFEEFEDDNYIKIALKYIISKTSLIMYKINRIKILHLSYFYYEK